MFMYDASLLYINCSNETVVVISLFIDGKFCVM